MERRADAGLAFEPLVRPDAITEVALKKLTADAINNKVEMDVKTLHLGPLVKAAADAFLALSAGCPHRNDTDCAEPSMEFSHMLCSASNCPLLLDAGA